MHLLLSFLPFFLYEFHKAVYYFVYECILGGQGKGTKTADYLEITKIMSCYFGQCAGSMGYDDHEVVYFRYKL